MTEHAINNGSSICQTAEATHLILTFREFCPEKTLGFTYSGQRAELEFHLVSDPKPPENRLSLYVRNISKRQWHVLTYAEPFNNNTDTQVKELPPNEDVFLYPIREFSFGNREELIIYFRFDRDAVMLQAPEVEREQLEYMWSRLQSLLKDSQFADMTVNGLTAHRAVLAAATGPLHETISALIHKNQSSEGSTTHDVCMTSEHNDVDTENANPMEEGKQNEVQPEHCNNNVNTDDDPPEGNSNKGVQTADLEKIAEDTKESFEERNLQNSVDSQNDKEIVVKECTSVAKTREDVNSESSKITENNASITAETVGGKRDSSWTENKIISLSQILNFFENQIDIQYSMEEATSMFNKFLTEHVEGEDEIEAMERPHPDNYRLEILQLRKKINTERFLEYIYTMSCDVNDEDHTLALNGKDLITVARLYALESLERDAVLRLCEKFAWNYTKNLLDFAISYDLYTLKRTVILLIRWNLEHFFQDPLGNYVLTMPPGHRYQNQCLFTLKVPNISKLMRDVTYKLFYICGCAVQVKVTRYSSVEDNSRYEIKLLSLSTDSDRQIDLKILLYNNDKGTFTFVAVEYSISLHDMNTETFSFSLTDIIAECVVDDTVEFVFMVDSVPYDTTID